MPDIETLKLDSSPEHRRSRKDLLVAAIAIAAFFFNLGMELGSNVYASVLVLVLFVVVAWLHRS